METKPKIHDNIIKHFLLDRKNAISVLKGMLPNSAQEQLDLDYIRYEKGSFLPKHLQEYYSDLVASVPSKCKTFEANVYFLFEHKSTYKKHTPLQFLRYIVEFWDHYLRNLSDRMAKLPVIIPILIAHPQEGWRPTKVSDLVQLPSDDFKIYIPDFEFLLFDAVKDDPEDYEFDEAVKALFTIWKYAHKNDFLQAVKRVFELIRKIDPEIRLHEYLKVILQYLELTREEEEYEEIKKIAETQINEGEHYMGTIAEMFRREGREETEQRLIQEKPQWIEHGKLEKAQENLIKSLKLRFEIVKPAVKERVRSIQSVDTVDDLFEISFKCSNMEEFTECLNEVTDN